MAGLQVPGVTPLITVVLPLPEILEVPVPVSDATLSRAALVQQFYLYDTDLLRRLLVIAQSILAPNQNQLISVDFSRMMEYADSLADAYWPEWTDRSSSDFGRFLVELMALFSDKDLWYINNLSREGFASLAQNYSNMVAKGVSNGVDVPLRKSASALFDLEALGGTAELILRGAVEFGISGFPELTFTNEEFILPAAASQASIRVRLYHGQVREFTGRFNGRSIRLTDPEITHKSVLLDVDGVRWAETTSFKLGNPQTKHYMVLPDETGRVELVFARGRFGARPAFGAVVETSYRVGGGLLGNLTPGTLSALLKAETERGVISIAQSLATTGGEEPWDLETLRTRTVTEQRTRHVATSADDAARLALEVPGVRRAHLTTISNFMFMAVVPEVGGVPSADLLAAVDAYMNDGRVLLGFTLITRPPEYVSIVLEADVYVLADQRNAGVKVVVEELLRTYLDEAQDAEFGRPITLVELNRMILSRVRGVQNVDFVRLQRAGGALVAPANVVLGPNQITRWLGTTVTIRVQGGI